ncbi:MAG: hypothetical protein JHC93_06595 [Parachlamydiales bacterium]|nr:hypothetical protein [Parachlamydiales bacterium]
MLATSLTKKNKIQIEDYNFERDIENRLFLSSFSQIEVTVLEEILNSSLHIDLDRLARTVDLDEKELSPILDRLESVGLLTKALTYIAVDKEMRKYFETQVVKFDESFEPNFDYIKSCLKKVPIDVLPNWYSIPRTSNDISSSIMEKYLLTPRIYQRYLSELVFDDPLLDSILDDVFSSPDLKVSAESLRLKYRLSFQEFEEYVLHLEFNFVLCSTYEQKDGYWEEIITPFHEWRQYLLFLKNTEPKSLPPAQVSFLHRGHFGFIRDMSSLLNSFAKNTSNSEIPFDKLTLSGEDIPQKERDAYICHLIEKMVDLQLVELDDNRYRTLPLSDQWLKWNLEEQGVALYRSDFFGFYGTDLPEELLTERNLREVERSLSRMTNKGWVLLDDFIKSMFAPVGNHCEVALKKVSRRWCYLIPNYSVEEKKFIELVITQRLMESGLVVLGKYRGQRAFCLTPFGQSLLTD